MTSNKQPSVKNINRSDIQDIFPLTPMQEGMLFHFLKDPELNAYREQLVLHIKGKIEEPLFRQAWELVLRFNEMLRVVFRWEKMKHPVQMILKDPILNWTFHDLSRLTGEEKEKNLEAIKQQDTETPFDLHEVPLRVIVCRTGELHYVMLLGYHHILLDGWSLGIVLKELFSVYGDLCANREVRNPLKPSFKSFIHWLNQQDREKEAAFWRNYLRRIEPGGGMQGDSPPAEAAEHHRKDYTVHIGKIETKKLEQFINDYKVTWATLLYLGWGLLLQTYCNRDDVIFGNTVSGRPAAISGIENMVGLFINTLPLRIIRLPGETVKESLDGLHQVLLERKNFEYTPLVNVNRCCERNSSESLFDSLLIVENYPLDTKRIQATSGLEVETYEMKESTHYDLTLTCRISSQTDIQFSYNQAVFSAGFIRRLSDHYLRMLVLIADNPNADTAKLELLSEDEKRRVLETFNDTAVAYSRDKTLHELCADQTQKTPYHIALTGPWGNGGKCGKDIVHLSYAEFDRQAERLAAGLRAEGVHRGSIVAIEMNRSVKMPVMMLGILKTGAAYLPVDPEYPQERIDFMLRDSGAVRAQGNYAESGTGTATAGDPCDLAYVIYTSGSTGKPKGVMIEHRNVVNFIAGMQGAIDFSDSRCVLGLTTIAFDIFVLETWLPFTMGMQVVIADETEQVDSRALAMKIVTHQIDTMQMTPSRLKLLFAGTGSTPPRQSFHCLQSVKTLIVGGEAFPAHLFRILRQGYSGKLYNVYGPTETTVWSTVSQLPPDACAEVTIGKPVANTGIYILDRFHRLQPVGVPGDLLIGGDGVARGYLNRPELTHEKFIRDKPFHLPQPLYRTGDLARWLENGDIEFLGRVDHQVKIRGFRIELEEIESLLLKHDRIKESLVVVKEAAQGDRYLCAYVVAAGEKPGTEELRDYLSHTLPAYSIPAFFVFLPEIPLTPNGKIDRNALPEPGTGDQETQYEAPLEGKETALAEVWRQIFDPGDEHPVGSNHHFFQLGGDSIKAIQVSSRLIKYGYDIKIKDIFAHPVLKDMARYVHPVDKRAEPAYRNEGDMSPETFGRISDFVARNVPGSLGIESLYRLNPTQKAMLHYTLMGGSKEIYLIQNLIRRHEPVLHRHLEEAMNILVESYDILRTVFLYDGLDEPLQAVLTKRDIKVRYEDITHLDVVAQTAFLEQARVEDVRTGFDLSRDPLVKLALFKHDDNLYTLLWTHHYIIMDGWSLGIIFNRLQRVLEEVQAGRPVTSEKSAPFGNYIRWLEKQDKTAALGYWREYLREYEPPPYLLPGKQGTLHEGEERCFTHYSFQLRQDESLWINRFAAARGVTVNTFFQALWGVLLQKLNNRYDVVFGAVVSGRPPEIEGIEEIPGLFIGTVPVRVKADAALSFAQLMKHIQENNMAAKSFEYLQFTEILSHLGLRGNIIDSLMTFQNFPGDRRVHDEHLEVETFEQSNYDINVIIFPATMHSPFRIKFIYNTQRFVEAMIKEIQHHLYGMIRQVMADENTGLQDIHLAFIGEKADTHILDEEEDDDWLG